MRGLWDHEQLLSPSLVRSAIALLGGFLAAVAVVNVVTAVALLAKGDPVGALGHATAGVAYPFAAWFAVRMVADLLALQHRTHDKVAGLDADDVPPPALAVRAPPAQPASAAAARAGDDGVLYPEDQ